MKKIRLLLVTAEPEGSSSIYPGKFFNAVKAGIAKAEKSSAFELDILFQSDLDSFFTKVEKFCPHILHLYGHGDELSNFYFEKNGAKERISPRHFFTNTKHYTDQLQCVIFSMCDSWRIANEISGIFKYTIGNDGPILVKTALDYSYWFYFYIASHNSVPKSHDKALSKFKNNEQAVLPNLFNALNDSHFALLQRTPSQPLNNRINPIPFFHPTSLIDRTDITREVNENLISENCRIVLLTGVGGIGKTTIALSYCNNSEYASQFDNIAWVTVVNVEHETPCQNKLPSEYDGFQSSFLRCLDDCESFDYKTSKNLSVAENYERLLKKMNQLSGHNLLVIDDNLNDPEYLLRNKSMLESINWKILISTRTRPDGFEVIEVSELEMKYSTELFLQHYKKYDAVDSKVLPQLLTTIHHHPLLIELVAKACNKNPTLNISKLFETVKSLDGLKKDNLQNLVSLETPQSLKEKEKRQRLHNFIMSLFDTIGLSFDEIQMLKLFSVLPPIDISYVDLLNMFKMADPFELLDNLCQKGWLISGHSADSSPEDISFKCHELIQTAIRHKYKPTEADCKTILEFLIDILRYEPLGDPFKRVKYVLFAESILEILKEPHVSTAELSHNLNDFFEKLGDDPKALHYGERAMLARMTLLGEQNIVTASSYNNVGVTHRKLGEIDRAHYFLEKALNIRKKEFGENNLSVAETLNNIATVYMHQANTTGALKYFNLAMEIWKKHTQTNDNEFCLYNMAMILNNIGMLYRDNLKNYNIAEFYLLESLNMYKKLFNETNGEIIGTKTNLGALYYFMDKKIYLEKAKQIFSEAKDYYFAIFGDESHMTINAVLNLAFVNKRLQNIEAGDYFFRSAINSLKKMNFDDSCIENLYQTYNSI